MPSYISHAIHAEELYKKINNEKMYKEEIELNRLRGYSIAYDYAFLSRGVDNHNNSARDYLLYIIRYIKDNHLEKNKDVLAYLYGHVAHFYLDALAHPLIYYIERGCMPSSFLPSHFMVEGYLNSYLAEKVLNKDIMDVNASYFNDINLNEPFVREMIFNSYQKVYNKKNVMTSFYMVHDFFNIIESLYKNIFKTMEVAKGITNFDFFLKRNSLTLDEMANSNHDEWLNPVTGKIHRESFLDLFNKSIEYSLETIKDINNYLYNDNDFSILEREIPDISLDTGVLKSRGIKMLYKRKH